jgi:transcriptional regulator with XRE-family HTH domain
MSPKPETMARLFGSELKMARENCKMSQEKLAKAIRLNRGSIANYEGGEAIDPIKAVMLAEALGADSGRFLLLSLLQGRNGTGFEHLASLVESMLHQRVSTTPPAGLRDGEVSLRTFPEAFRPLTIIVGDKREDDPRTPGDLYAFTASPVDDRWIMSLGLPRETEKLSDKIVMTATREWLQSRLGKTHLLCIGSPASNLFAREYNDHFLFRFAISKATVARWREKRDEIRSCNTPAKLAAFRESVGPHLRQTMRLFKQSGFVDFNYPELVLGIDPSYNRDFAVLSIGRNPFASHGDRYFSVLAAGGQYPGTANAVRFLANKENFVERPLGGILEVEVPSDRYNPNDVPWQERIEKSEPRWHCARTLPRSYTISQLRVSIERWLTSLASLVGDVAVSEEEMMRHLELLDAIEGK